MYNKVLFIILLLSCITGNSQSNNSSVEKIYKNLSEKKLKYIQFSDSLGLLQGKQKIGKYESEFVLVEISKFQNLGFKKYSDYNPNSSFYFRDSIFLFNKKYCIDNLFYEKKTLQKQEALRLNYTAGYTFSLNSKDYISLFFWDSTLPTSNPFFFIILFDISNKKNIKAYFFNEQMSFTPNCFGDFDNDGILDFANWIYNSPINCLTLVKDKFKNIKNKFVVIKQEPNRTFSIDWKKSKWFKNN